MHPIDLSNDAAEEAVRLLGTHARLLVALDFDGTISQFTLDPQDAALEPAARVALRKLSELPNTYVSVISGRSLSDLTLKFNQLDRVRLVGSHGHEFDLDKISALSEDQLSLLQRAQNLVQDSVSRCPGSRIELKPHGVVFHFRGADPSAAVETERLRGELKNLAAGLVRDGNMVLEYCITTTDKGDALARIRDQVAPTITLFIGDDITDEAAFKRLSQSDITIKVGGAESSARFRVESPEKVAQLLVWIAERRATWMDGLQCAPIDRHLFLSDLRTCALVDQGGTVSWLCTPRIDSAPLFGALVGGPGAGHFRITALGEGRQEYLGNSLIGKTAYDSITVTDFFDCSNGRTYQRAGRSDFIRLLEGRGEVSAEFAPKFNFGRVPTRLSGIENGLRIECGQQRLVLLSPGWDWEISREGAHDVARSVKKFSGERAALILLIGTVSAGAPAANIDRMLAQTKDFWEGWVSTLKLPQQHAELIARSALALRALIYGPTGALAAAATTSLPEALGSGRNWDYRYCWPRDACLAASALLRLDAIGPGMRLLDWALAVVFDSEDDRFLAPLYSVTGRTVMGEAEVAEAIGYRGSRPVRIGNLAAEQLQLDALGPIAELMAKLAARGASLTEEHHQLAERLVSLVQSRWNDADSGIWEVRGAQRHFVHSKLMCWYTVHCCIAVSRYLGVARAEWEKLAEEIRVQIETNGFNEELQSYVAAYDLSEADSALVWVVLSGFHPPDHPRSRGTVNYIMRNLIHDGNVYRYHFDDSLHGGEGEFIICRCWLIEALMMMQERTEAERLFEELRSRIAPLGLLSEQWDTGEQCALGNYPQAYSHAGLINAVCALDPSGE